MPRPVIHFEIVAAEAARLRQFYGSLFGWTFNADNPMNYALTSAKDGDVGIDGAIFEQPDPDEFRGVRLFTDVDDADAYLNRVVELGESIIMPATDVPGADIRVGMFADPESNHFGVSQNTANG